MSDAELRARSSRSSRPVAVLAAVALLLEVAVGVVWLAYDAANLAPGESYYWPLWYVLAFLAWMPIWLALCLLWQAVRLVRWFVTRMGRSKLEGARP